MIYSRHISINKSSIVLVLTQLKPHWLKNLQSTISSYSHLQGVSPGESDGKESACSAGDPGLIPGSGRASGEGNGNPLQYFCLENPMDGGAWQATVHRVSKSQT